MLNRILGARRVAPAKYGPPTYLRMHSIATGGRLTEDQAFNYSAFWAGVTVLSRTVAMLPWRHFAQEGDRRVVLSGSSVDRLLHRRPNPEMTPFAFKELLQSCAVVWGNAYAEIEYSGSGEPVALWPMLPSQVTPMRDGNLTLYYEVRGMDGQTAALPAAKVFHHRGPTLDGITGRSLIACARESIGVGIASEQFAAGFLGNGGSPSYAIIDTPEAARLDAEGVANMLASFERRHGGASKAGRAAYLEAGRKIEMIGIPHKDAQFIEQRKFQVTEMARWFGLPPHKLGDLERASFSNIESQNIDFVVDSIMPWAVRLEEEANAKLLTRDDEFTKINLLGLLRGDSQARGEYYNKMFNIGVFSPNRILELEDMDPVDGGDQHFVPLNMIPLSRATSAQALEGRGRLTEAYARMISVELNAVERLVKGGKATGDFFEGHRDRMISAMTPGVEVTANEMGVDVDRALGALARHVDAHIEQSKSDAASGAYPRWPKRLNSALDQLLERIASC